MTTNLPIVCSLDADELPRRLAEMIAVGGRTLIDVTAEPGRAVLRFIAGGDTRQRLARIVDAERTCCAFMHFTLDVEPDAIVLTIQAPEGAEAVTDALVGAFSGRGETP